MNHHWIRFTAMVLTALSAGCVPLPEVNRGEIILDAERRLLCLNTGFQCRSLGLIIANRERYRVLKAYGLPPWNGKRLDSVEELSQLLLKPPQGNYAVERLGPSRYRLPINDQTYTAWKVLDEEYRNRYCDPGDLRC